MFAAEIVPLEAVVYDKDGNEKKVIVDRDDGVRPGTTPESLAKLKPVFDENGSTTAGNASQVSDGAAAVLLMKRKTAQKYGLPIIGKYITSAVVGVPPKIMGVGPAYAIPVAVERAGLKIEDVDIYEINEAFASQSVYSVEKLGIPFEKVNPKGGAIAFGHPGWHGPFRGGRSARAARGAGRAFMGDAEHLRRRCGDSGFAAVVQWQATGTGVEHLAALAVDRRFPRADLRGRVDPGHAAHRHCHDDDRDPLRAGWQKRVDRPLRLVRRRAQKGQR